MKFLVDPTKLKPIVKKESLVQVIIETPTGSRNKFAYDPDQGIFALKKFSPLAWCFRMISVFFLRLLHRMATPSTFSC